MEYVIADMHFNHNNIIKYCNRPFENVQEMNEYIISKWNEDVSKNDIIYVLGDVGFGSTENLGNIINRLNGNKILILGNHDRKRSINSWRNLGFQEVHKKPITVGNAIFSHEPIKVDENTLNIFGHIHNKPYPEEFNDDNHICVSLERTEYKPVPLWYVMTGLPVNMELLENLIERCNIDRALKEVELIQKGVLPKKSWDEFVKESNNNQIIK